jgi:hypothetical protein
LPTLRALERGEDGGELDLADGAMDAQDITA